MSPRVHAGTAAVAVAVAAAAVSAPAAVTAGEAAWRRTDKSRTVEVGAPT